MILIGISGSTKSDWRLLKEGDVHKSFSGKGINPFVQQEEDIINNIREADHFEEYADYVKVVYLYSAGCSNKKLQIVVQRALTSVFPKAYYYVNHDIVAAALATYEGVPAISSILGTGSNSCYFDGDIVKQEIPALDFILGNEGSGTYYGKWLLKYYIYKQLPSDLHIDFKNSFELDSNIILEKVHLQPNANVYLASFMPFMEKHKDHPFIMQMLQEGMDAFMRYFILCYKNYEGLKCHFVGSIAITYKDILMDIAQKHNITVGKVIKEPINGLVDYLIKKHYVD